VAVKALTPITDTVPNCVAVLRCIHYTTGREIIAKKNLKSHRLSGRFGLHHGCRV